MPRHTKTKSKLEDFEVMPHIAMNLVIIFILLSFFVIPLIAVFIFKGILVGPTFKPSEDERRRIREDKTTKGEWNQKTGEAWEATSSI